MTQKKDPLEAAGALLNSLLERLTDDVKNPDTPSATLAVAAKVCRDLGVSAAPSNSKASALREALEQRGGQTSKSELPYPSPSQVIAEIDLSA